MLRLCVLVLGVAAISCKPGDTLLDMTFDPCEPLVLAPLPEATAEEIASVDLAAAFWNDLLHSRVGRAPHPHAQRIAISFEVVYPALFGTYRDELGEIMINRRIEDARERAVTVAHELGHAFGLWHVEESTRDSVMNPGNLEQSPNAEDAAAVIAIWGACAPPEETRPPAVVPASRLLVRRPRALVP